MNVAREPLINCGVVIPAQTGIQSSQDAGSPLSRGRDSFRIPSFIRRALAALAFVTAALTAGCVGEDGKLAGVGSGGTGPGTASVGPITGFGSVHVNGIRFDDAAAVIRTEDGAGLDRSQLDLGMWVEVLGSVDASGTSGRADEIRVVRAARGVVTDVDLQRNEFRVLGALVLVNANTLFGGTIGTAGLDGLRVGDAVDVHGALDDRGARIFATRVQRVTAGPFSRRGRISALTPTTFMLGGLTVNYAAARVDAPQGLADGVLVTVIAAAPPVAGVLNADRVIAVPEFPSSVFEVALEGVVNQFDSLASFRVAHTRIDATQASVSGGDRTDIKLGARLFVRGTIVQGVLVAREVVVLGAIVPPLPAIASGPITVFNSVSDFQVRGTRIDASAATFVNGTAVSLAVGRVVVAQGSIVNGVLRATVVIFP